MSSIPRAKSYGLHWFRVGPWHFEVGNYEDWKPGYQLNLEEDLGFLDHHKTFDTPQDVETYVRAKIKELAASLLGELK